MGESKNSEIKRSIICVRHPDGTFTAKEVLAHLTKDDELSVTPLPGTERKLPLSRVDAESWVDAVTNDLTEDGRQALINDLCCQGHLSALDFLQDDPDKKDKS